jgi:hypothetical protein
MAVYMIRAGEDGPVKIGKAVDPIERMAVLQTYHFLTLHIMRVFEGGEVEERALHQRFARLRIRGEWFAFAPELQGDVGLPETTVEAITTAIADPYKAVPVGFDKMWWRQAVKAWRTGDKSGDPYEIYQWIVDQGYAPAPLPDLYVPTNGGPA